MKSRAVSALVAAAAIVAAVAPLQRISAQPVPVAVPTVAAGYRAPAAEPSPPGLVGVTERPFVPISLQDAVAMSLLRNPNLAITAGNVRIARFNVVSAKSPFDVQLHLQPSSSYQVLPPQNIFFAGPGIGGLYLCQPLGIGQPYPCTVQGPGNIITHQYQVAGGIQGQSVNGTLYSAGITRTRTYNNLIINLFSPYYQSSLNLGLDQPLMRNFGMNEAKHDYKLAILTADTSEAQALVDVSSTLEQVEDSYWDLVASWRNVAIAEDALKEAIAQQRTVVRLAKQGAAPPVTAVEVQTQVSNFQSDVFSALQEVAEIQNQLKSQLVTGSQDPIWGANLVPSSPVQELPSPGDLAQIVAQAQTNRPEVRVVRNQRRAADLDRAYAKNQLLPQADFQVQYQSNGFAGQLAPIPQFEQSECSAIIPTGICPTPPPETQGKMGKATGNMWAWRYPTFNVALIFSVPLQNLTARSLMHSAQQEQAQAEISMQQLDQRIGAESRNALQAFEASLSRLYAARTSRESAESVYASEVRRFNAGESTTFLVLQRQTELAQARGRELQAQTDLNKSVVELQRVEGTILSANDVDLKTMGSKALATSPP
ncbi:MAG TPA: TolC family protein [Candidatus Cybelea sp.]|nr:TolC family protein [Candidatus Cybelea sp.]